MYKLNYSPFTGKCGGVIRLSDNASIPLCEANSDYQEFLNWNSEQTVPLDLKSTIPVIPPEKPRDYLAEIDALKIQVAANTDSISTIAIATKTDISVKPTPINPIKEG